MIMILNAIQYSCMTITTMRQQLWRRDLGMAIAREHEHVKVSHSVHHRGLCIQRIKGECDHLLQFARTWPTMLCAHNA